MSGSLDYVHVCVTLCSFFREGVLSLGWRDGEREGRKSGRKIIVLSGGWEDIRWGGEGGQRENEVGGSLEVEERMWFWSGT